MLLIIRKDVYSKTKPVEWEQLYVLRTMNQGDPDSNLDSLAT